MVARSGHVWWLPEMVHWRGPVTLFWRCNPVETLRPRSARAAQLRLRSSICSEEALNCRLLIDQAPVERVSNTFLVGIYVSIYLGVYIYLCNIYQYVWKGFTIPHGEVVWTAIFSDHDLKPRDDLVNTWTFIVLCSFLLCLDCCYLLRSRSNAWEFWWCRILKPWPNWKTSNLYNWPS